MSWPRCHPVVRALGASLITLVLAAASLAAQTPSRARIQAVADSLAADALANGPIAGLAIAVVRGRDTLVMKGYGYADLENDVPVTPQTVFQIGSVTKQFTSAAVMQLVEQGKISLDDDITKYLQNAPTHGRRVLVRHLLNHTSGIVSFTELGPTFRRAVRLDLPRDSVIALVHDDSLMFEPGTGYSYNNTGYFLLGMLLEKVTGQPYATYMNAKLFAPFGLASTSYCTERSVVKHRARGYQVAGKRFLGAEVHTAAVVFSAGALCSTMSDLVSWTRALHGGQVVSRASLMQMTTPVTLSNGYHMRYGYGLIVDSVGSHRMVWHDGRFSGFVVNVAHFPKDTLTIAVAANSAPFSIEDFTDQIARAAFGMPFGPPPLPKEIALTAADRARYVGSYTLGWPNGTTAVLRVVEEAGQLRALLPGQAPVQLVAIGADSFLAPQFPGMTIRFAVAGNRATHVVLDRALRPVAGKRAE
jgi:D-alanyl-D-alanine carboxypeptidase